MPAATKKKSKLRSKSVKRFQFEVEPIVHMGIKALCATEGISLATFGRQAINDQVAKINETRLSRNSA